MQLRRRETYWDTLKGLLIFLVVLGHTGSCLGEKLTSVIYIFHMPLFILVSGYFSNPKALEKYMKGIKQLLGFYLLFHIIYIVYDVKCGTILTLSRILIPSFGLWYLLSLCYWRTLIQFFHAPIKRFPLLFIGGSILLSIGVGFIPLDSQMSFQRTFTFFPFFILGYYAKQFNWLDGLRHFNRVNATIILLVLMVVVYVYVFPFYANAHFDKISDCFIRCLQLGIALLVCICMLRIVPQKLSIMTTLGTYTLIVYLFHPPLILIGKRILDYLHLPHNPLSGIIIAVIAILIISLIKDLKFIRIFNR